MPARVRTKRRSSLPAIRISRLRPSTYNLRTDEVRTIVCPDCQTWQQIVGDTTLTIRDHFSTDLSGAELQAGGKDTRCPSARRIVLIDLTDEEIKKWAKAQNRPMKADAMPAETRRAARQHYKPLPPQAPAVHQIAERRQAAPIPTPAERASQWASRLLPVFVADAERRIALIDTPGDVQGPIRGIEAPTKTLRPAA